ncbi:acetyltransferase GNAT family [Rhodotorula toruloides]|uniref:Acetyltransferase GNAT family n=1 Tax=Rhodotorula toruloides TaxID=5286 RepID=A0A511KGL8_RHOTO|nr:acetyltransferase GNAT family [Rhodotorula toruloides]
MAVLAQKPEVELLPVTQEDLPLIAEGHLAAFPTFYAPLEPSSELPSHKIRVQRFTHRLSRILSRPDTLWTRANLATGPEKGKFVGLAVWHKPGAPVVNPKRRWVEGVAEESAEDKEAWEHVDMEAWEKVWTEWDAVRARIMDGKDHWYLCPVWVVPGYQGLGIGRKLMQQVLDLCDAQQPSTPIYLEASKEGKPLYEKLGFEVVGTSDYVEMVRWGKRE